jgi:anti-sigma regulatory factor (Ser/Thr protein kinase)
VCRLAMADFNVDLTAPAAVRRWVGGHLVDWGLHGLVDTSLLLVSEVATNAIIHACSGPAISLSVAEGTLEIGVGDQVGLLPAASDAVEDADPDNTALLGEGGRGLLLIELMADSWGATRLRAGKHVWFRLDVGGWDDRHACMCHRPHPGRVRLDSGRFARHLAPGGGHG